jgi:hypothetical protein
MMVRFQLAFLSLAVVQAFIPESSVRRYRSDLKSLADENGEPVMSRREACFLAVAGATVSSGLVSSEQAWAEDAYRPAKRPTAYFVDSTQPPTLIPLSSARKEIVMLSALGRGLGTEKEAIRDDRVSLNNIMNKAVFGSIDAVSAFLNPTDDEESMSGPGYASFVCLGVPFDTTATDVDLAVSLLNPIVQARKIDTALGLAFCPLSAQSDLDAFSKSGDEAALVAALIQKAVPAATAELYLPLFRCAKSNSLQLLAMSPEMEDILTARTRGLQNISPERRSSYVMDTDGFIALSTSPKFRLYSDRSLLKDFEALMPGDKPGDFFAERILVHETAAGAVAQYATKRPESLVAIVAPTPDLRFLGGINGRIPRVCGFLNKESNKVTDNAVTTILLNPTALETLSKSRYLRLEIGTGPDSLEFQTKVADYLWFSSSPKVNLIPRLMNG